MFSTRLIRFLAALGATLALAAPLASAQAPAVKQTEAEKLAAVAERYFQDGLVLNPLFASQVTGDAKYEGELEIDISPVYRVKMRTLLQRVQRELVALNLKQLSPADQLTYALLEDETRNRLESMRYPGDLLPVNQYGGLPVQVAQFGSGQDIQPLKTLQNYRNYLKRLDKIPEWNEQAIVNMRAGIERGVVQPLSLIHI